MRMDRSRLATVACWLAAASFTGCASRSESSPALDAAEGEAVGGTAYEPSPAAPSAAAQAPARGRAVGGAEEKRRDDGKREDEGGAPKAGPRMVFYNGYCKLRVTQPKDVLSAAVAVVEREGGYVERFASTTATLRVPVAKFQEVFKAIAALGDVVSRSITAQDITDSYVAVDLRLKTLKASRDRLIELLARAKSEHEKLSLLREIRRLTEEVDQLQLELETLASLANYSRITLEVEPRHVNPGEGPQELVAAFRWIRALNPFRRDVAHQGDRWKLQAPEGMVAIDDPDLWSAESADGVVLWTSTRSNEPRGDTAFWLEAVKQRLSPEFGRTTTQQIGAFSALHMVDAGDAGYRYVVALQAVGDELKIVEVYYPSAALEDRYAAAINRMLTQGGAS